MFVVENAVIVAGESRLGNKKYSGPVDESHLLKENYSNLSSDSHGNSQNHFAENREDSNGERGNKSNDASLSTPS